MTKKLILFYAPGWCGHCKPFIKIVPEIKKCLDPSYEQPEKEPAIEKTKYWEIYTDDKKNTDDEKEIIQKAMEKYKVGGFPTIIIEDSNGKLKPYNGKRNTESILEALECSPTKAKSNSNTSSCQTGGAGSNDMYYKMKYLKYKAKYLNLLDKLLK